MVRTTHYACGDTSARGLHTVDPPTYSELLRQARAVLRYESANHPWEAADLLHEVFVRLAHRVPGIEFKDRNHFLAVARITMRRVLIDYARSTTAYRSRRVHFHSEICAAMPPGLESIALRHALQEMELQKIRLYRVIQMRFFWGLELAEIASVLSVSTRTVKRDWNSARAWLTQALANHKCKS